MDAGSAGAGGDRHDHAMGGAAHAVIHFLTLKDSHGAYQFDSRLGVIRGKGADGRVEQLVDALGRGGLQALVEDVGHVVLKVTFLVFEVLGQQRHDVLGGHLLNAVRMLDNLKRGNGHHAPLSVVFFQPK